jgi:hypothetical protein
VGLFFFSTNDLDLSLYLGQMAEMKLSEIFLNIVYNLFSMSERKNNRYAFFYALLTG